MIGDVAYYQNSDPDGTLRAIRAGPNQESSDLQTRWTYRREDVDGYPMGYVSATSETVYYGYNDGQLHAIDAESGGQEWVFDAAPGVFREPPTVTDDSVYVTSRADPDDGASVHGTVHALSAETGEERWSYETEFTPYAPTVEDGVVYVATEFVDDSTANETDGFRAFAFDEETGDERWSNEITWFTWGSPTPPTVADGTLYTGYRDHIFALDTQTGDARWVGKVGDGVTSMWMPTVADGTVFTYTSESDVVALDAETGEVDWRSGLDDGDAGMGLVIVAGALFLVTREYSSISTSYAINAGVEGSSVDSAVRLGTFGHHHERAGTEPPAEPYAIPSGSRSQSTDSSSESGGTDESAGDTGGGDGATKDSGGDEGDGMPGFGIGAALTTLAGLVTILKHRGASLQDRE